MGDPKNRGGARPGAGRPKGSKNKRTSDLRERLVGTEEDPVNVLLEFIGPENPVALRIDAAKTLMQYAHPRLTASKIEAKLDSRPLTIEIVAKADKPDAADSD